MERNNVKSEPQPKSEWNDEQERNPHPLLLLALLPALFVGSSSSSLNNFTFFTLVLLLITCLTQYETIGATENFNKNNFTFIFNISIPNSARRRLKDEEYLCSVRKLEMLGGRGKALYLEEFAYIFSKEGGSHHFLLYGCKSVAKYAVDNAYWSCTEKRSANYCFERKHVPIGVEMKGNSLTNSSNSSFIRTTFPDNVAFGVGSAYDVNYLMLEIHFKAVESCKIPLDGTNIVMAYGTMKRPKNLAGMMVLAAGGFTIPPGQSGMLPAMNRVIILLSMVYTPPDYPVDINCRPRINSILTPFAYWAHTHGLGKVVSGYKMDNHGHFVKLAHWIKSERLPQPVMLDYKVQDLEVHPSHFIAGRCIYDSSNKTAITRWGPRHSTDEMCNLFVFYFTNSSLAEDLSISCVNENFDEISMRLPTESRSSRYPIIASPKVNNNSTRSMVCLVYEAYGIKECPFKS